ncbi:glutamyl-tRNA reductase [Puniceicoccaceae bacterium K14]|nr:glutamyl-tRNA reductase [Puniceicoccaceae bacterium K14]
MSSSKSRFLIISINHENVPLEQRERYAIDDDQVEAIYQPCDDSEFVTESLILNTCNRFELYICLNSDKNEEDALEILAKFYELNIAEIKEHARLFEGLDAVSHLIEVSAGLRSQIIGEVEIYGQVKNAYAYSYKRKSVGTVLNRIFQKGFQAVKLIRNSTQIGEGQVNISNVAVNLSTKIFGNLKGTSALILGTGEIGEKTAKALKSRGATHFGVASRTLSRAEEVAGEWGAVPIAMDQINEYLDKYDIVLASTIVEEPLITKKIAQKALSKRKGRPLFLIDLGMPRNIDQSCEDLDNVFLYNLDDLAAIAEENQTQRQRAVADSKAIANQKSEAIWANLVTRGQVQ